MKRKNRWLMTITSTFTFICEAGKMTLGFFEQLYLLYQKRILNASVIEHTFLFNHILFIHQRQENFIFHAPTITPNSCNRNRLIDKQLYYCNRRWNAPHW